jgi:catechol 2,3-dioxygenase-like lactoylglutathione lyase family enzyme
VSRQHLKGCRTLDPALPNLPSTWARLRAWLPLTLAVLFPLVDAARAGDRFDPFRVGLDHLSFAVGSRADLDAAVARYDEAGVDHGPIREVAAMGMAFLAAFDPDGIAIELTATI